MLGAYAVFAVCVFAVLGAAPLAPAAAATLGAICALLFGLELVRRFG